MAMQNNIDIALQKLRQLQAMLFDRNISQNEIFKLTEEIAQYMNLASTETVSELNAIRDVLKDGENKRR